MQKNYTRLYVIKCSYQIQKYLNRYVSPIDRTITDTSNLNCEYIQLILNHNDMSKSARAVEFTDCISAKGEDSTKEFPRYDTKQSNTEAPLMLKIWGKWSTTLWPSLPSPLYPGVVAHYRVLSMGQI